MNRTGEAKVKIATRHCLHIDDLNNPLAPELPATCCFCGKTVMAIRVFKPSGHGPHAPPDKLKPVVGWKVPPEIPDEECFGVTGRA